MKKMNEYHVKAEVYLVFKSKLEKDKFEAMMHDITYANVEVVSFTTEHKALIADINVKEIELLEDEEIEENKQESTKKATKHPA